MDRIQHFEAPHFDDSELRVEALRQSVNARREEDTPKDLVVRAEALYAFLAATP